jgi:hypothetical protein
MLFITGDQRTVASGPAYITDEIVKLTSRSAATYFSTTSSVGTLDQAILVRISFRYHTVLHVLENLLLERLRVDLQME